MMMLIREVKRISGPDDAAPPRNRQSPFRLSTNCRAFLGQRCGAWLDYRFVRRRGSFQLAPEREQCGFAIGSGKARQTTDDGELKINVREFRRDSPEQQRKDEIQRWRRQRNGRVYRAGFRPLAHDVGADP